MSIQGVLNQATSVGAALYSQSATYKQKTEEKIAEQQKTQQLEQAYNRAEKAGTAYADMQLALKEEAEKTGVKPEPIPESAKRALYSEDVQASADLYRLDPTGENAYNYSEAVKRYESLFKTEQKRQNKMEQSKIIQDNINRWGEINGKK